MVELDSGLTLRALLKPGEFSKAIPFIEMFLARSEGESSVETIRDNVFNNRYQCWFIEDGDEVVSVCITKIDEWISYKSLHILGLGALPGYWESFRDAHKWLEEWAKEIGCDRMSVWTNRAWLRLFQKADFTGINGEKYEEKYKVLHMKL